MPHHDEQLTDDDGLVQLVLNLRKVLFIVTNAFVVNDEHGKAVIVAVHQNGLGNLQAYQLRHVSQLSSLNNDVLVLNEGVVLSKEANVDSLLSVDLVAVLAESLANLEAGDDSFVVGIFVSDLVWSLCSQPLVSPILQVKSSVWNGVVVTFL